ncbi:MAG TPA: acetyl-CoA carboxylase biotin carboxyl carrier protein [Microbacterium sp.]|uniref:acetyl-CoA carboxylase biotin carboxyl carrier protein n=1 Tax=Microbacterium sp. TaxID=51671 RepID=UPI002CDDA6F3|nr:acetyl-CoA carboxylase biotin carboxyl carrier protein [Microbacterium sp.]HWI31281.1 acetyl-CoA carboxylase biotin carboxyl carrier protein [Microbacterium sp.]
MSLDQPDIRELRALVDWVNLSADVRELSVTIGDVELFISRDRQSPRLEQTSADSAPAVRAPAAPAPAVPAQAQVAAVPEPAPVGAVPEAVPVAAAPAPHVPTDGPAADEVLIKAPMVGTFYGSPKPGDPPFVQVGDTVAADTVLGIVEVMKLMNNIEAKVAGSVVRILVDNEQAVEYGQALMVIRRHD